MLRVRFFLPLLFGFAALAAACGGSGGGSPLPAPSTTPATPHAGPTQVPVGPSPQAVDISGDGYTLSFDMPPVSAGSPTTLNAVLQTALPTGTVAPQAVKRGYTAPRALPTTFSALVYLVITTGADSVGFSEAPNFQFSMPSSVTIPSTSNAYVLYWDPYSRGQAWQPIVKGGVNAQIVTFPSIATGMQFNAGSTYVFALAETAQVVPTATPAPTPTPTAAPTASPTPTPAASPGVLPAYCQTEGVSQSSGLTLNLTDSSGLKSALVVYVQQQAPLGGSISWMNATGGFGLLPVPLPAACYSSTLGSSATNNPLVVPTGHAGRIYLVYASPVPASSTSAPNPFSGLSAGSQPGNNVAQFPYPYDKIEFNSTSGVIDTTQVDFLGLPLEMQAVPRTNATPLPLAATSPCPAPIATASPYPGNALPAPGTIVGVGQCGYQAIYSSLYANTQYQPLVSMLPLPWGTQTLDFRAINPGGAYGNDDFNFNLLGDSSVSVPSTCSALVGGSTGTYGYLSCVLAQYQQRPQVFRALFTLGGNGDNDYFCVSADSSDFIATDVSPSTTCGSAPKATSSALPANPFRIPIALFTNAYYTASGSNGSCFYGELFNGPYGNAYVGSSQPFATADAFTLWKALTLEINYGTTFVDALHPVETTPPSLQSTGMFADPASNFYAKTVHEYFDGNFAYAISYDDGFKWFSGYSLTAPGTINLRVNAVPSGSTATSSNPPIFNTSPTCATFTLGVGGQY